MSGLPRAAQAAKRPAPAFLKTAKGLYGDAFEPRTQREVGDAMADWHELSESEQSFTLGHLLYLNLRAQAAQLRVLQDLRVRLTGAEEALQELVEQGEGDEGDAPIFGDFEEAIEEEPAEPEGDDGPSLNTEALARAQAEADAIAARVLNEPEEEGVAGDDPSDNGEVDADPQEVSDAD